MSALCRGGRRCSRSCGLKLLAEDLDGFGQDACTETEGALDQAYLAADIAREVERSGLAFAQRTHDLEALDRGIGRLQSLEATDRADQLLQLAMVRLDHVVQVLGLSMDGVLRAFTLLLQLGKSRSVGGRLIRVDDVR